MLDLILVLMGITMLVAGILTITESIRKKNFEKSFFEAGGMLVFGIILVLTWISNMF